MKYYLGIDGGGTKTSFLVIDENNNIVYSKTLGSSSIDTVSFNEFEQVIENGTKDIKYPISGVFAGIGGVISDNDILTVKSILSQIPCLIDKTKISCDNDCVNALYGGLNTSDGIVVICGTGSVAYGKYNSQTHRVGGFGYLEGDLGSSYDLGRKALQYLGKTLDKRLPESLFSKALCIELNVYDTIKFTKYINNATRTEIAQLAKIVTKYEKEEEARNIIDNATSEIALMIKTVYNVLGFKDTTKLSIQGSLGLADTLYKKMLHEKINKISKDIIIVNNAYNPAIGGMLKS